MRMYQTVSHLLKNPRALVYLNDQYIQENFKFKNHDIQFLKLFWQPNFDDEWILLDEPFIETWLIQDTNLNLNQLYHQVLTMFHKDTDYKPSLDTNTESMYMVKGYCLKNLCIICNKLFRDFFIRLGRVAHMLILSKSIDENTTQIKLNKNMRQLDAISTKTDNLLFIVEEIMNERIAEIADKVVRDTKCDEVVNIVRLPQQFNASQRMPSHLINTDYIVIRCLRKNYDKHLNKIKSYIADSCNMIEEIFNLPIVNRGIDVVKALKEDGIKTYKNNGVSTDDHITLMEKVKNILGIE
jgi:hypothetical protein